MSGLVPLPIMDDFLRQYTLGQVLLLMFLLVLPVGYVRGSRKITAINITLFGLLFAIVPSLGDSSIYFAYLGIALLLIGPVLYSTAGR